MAAGTFNVEFSENEGYAADLELYDNEGGTNRTSLVGYSATWSFYPQRGGALIISFTAGGGVDTFNNGRVELALDWTDMSLLPARGYHELKLLPSAGTPRALLVGTFQKVR